MRALLIPLFLLLSGCGFLFGDDGMFRDSSADYENAQELEPIKLPPGRQSERINEIYAIPPIESEPQFASGDDVPRPAPLVSGNADQLVRIQKLGDDSWALIAVAPGQLWPQLRAFLSAANIEIARMDARAGIIETTYLELQNQTQPSRFQLRVDRGVQRGNSELHVLQMYQRNAEGWPEQSDDGELESEMLRSVAQYIANSADTAPVSMMAEQSINSSARVVMDDDAQGPLIRLELPFNRAWASTARSLDLSGFDITDRNRSTGIYYITYVGEQEEEKSGWFGWFGGGEDQHPAAGVPLLLTMETVGEDRMELRLRPEKDADALSVKEIQSLLVLIKGNIN